MILGCEEETRKFVTTCKKDYNKKIAKRPKECIQSPSYSYPLNFINGPYAKHLKTKLKTTSLLEEERSENPEEFLNKLLNKYSYLRKKFPARPLNENLLAEVDKKSSKSVYQVEISKHLDDYVSIRAQRTGQDKPREHLPNDCYIPQSTQGYSHRDPWKMTTKDFFYAKIITPVNNLGPNIKEREILRVRTGNSEYNEKINAVGILRMKKHL
ncbi:uncharacterized protein [Prorops nasuta]|uniref:uncharacterized protein n=1 Tax=Prorops nasuta TaxID=863751 RepID=UPI0034CD1BE0